MHATDYRFVVACSEYSSFQIKLFIFVIGVEAIKSSLKFDRRSFIRAGFFCRRLELKFLLDRHNFFG